MLTHVVGFAVDELSRVALVRKARPVWQRGRLNGVGGKVESGESGREAMDREWSEETSGDPLLWSLRAVVDELQGQRFAVFGAAATSFQLSALRGLPAEPIELHSAISLHPDVLPNLRWMVALVLDPGVIGADLRYDRGAWGFG